MIELSAGDIAAITGGELIDGAAEETHVEGPVEFDSRKIAPGSIFMALPGATVDGHDYVAAAGEQGAALAIVGRPVGYPALLAPASQRAAGTDNSAVFGADDEGYGAAVLAAVDKLARHNTDVLADEESMVVVGITGSAGKTSTKDLIGALLGDLGETVAPPGSFNNEIGLPYTALRAGRDTKFLVSEMSARGVGHIAHLTTVTPPKIGVELNVGSAHLGEFGSREAIAQAKGELVEALPAAEDGGIAILNADDDAVIAMRHRTRARVVTFALDERSKTGERADYWASDIRLDEVARASFRLHHPYGEPVDIRLGVFGAHQVSNALAAAAVAVESGMLPASVARVLGNHVAASANRMDVRTRADGATIINDSYNANPESMRAGIDALAYTAGGRPEANSWAVLGQMGELGEESAEEHTELGKFLGTRGIDHAVIVGTGINQRAIADAAREHGVDTRSVEDVDAAVNFVDQHVKPKDVVLVKASYSDGLWAVAEGLLADEGA